MGFMQQYLLVLIVSLCTLKAHCGSVDDAPDPPPYQDKAKTARYVAHYTGWAVVATISTMSKISGRPFSNIFSFCDGTMANSTGVPYFYAMSQDASMKDIFENSFISMTMSEEMTDLCAAKHYDPEDPRCARLTLTGKMVNVTGSDKDFALKALFARHPAMASWSVAHEFYPTKLMIDMIWLIDYFGGATKVPVKDYFAVKL